MTWGLSDRSTSGSRWSAIRAFSRVNDGLMFLV